MNAKAHREQAAQDFVKAVRAHLEGDVKEPYYLALGATDADIVLYECSRCGAAVPFRAFQLHDKSHPENEPTPERSRVGRSAGTKGEPGWVQS